MSLRTLICAASVAVLAACSSTGPAFERIDDPPRLWAKSVELQVTDARPEVSTEEVDVPMMSFKGQGQELALRLEARLQTALEFALRQNLAPSPRRLRIDVRVLEGVASWSGNWMSESEKGSAKVAVAVYDADANRLLVSGEAESWAQRTSMDTSDFRVKRILATAVQGAALEFLASDAARAALGGP